MPRTDADDQWDNYRAHVDCCSDCRKKPKGRADCEQGQRAWARYVKARNKERG